MPIVTFWSNGEEQTGKTLSIAAIATYLSIEHNKRILIVSTGYNDKTLDNCFWKERKIKRNLGIFGPNTNIAMDEGIVGLTKIINSNKLSPENITNYTKIVFKDRLEVLQSFKGERTDYERLKQVYSDIINLANNYYDLVLVDLDRELEQEISDTILGNSNLIVANISQRLSSIDRLIELREQMQFLNSNRTLILVGRYDKNSKYTIKNMTRYMGEKNKVSTIPYNTLFFEASEEAKVPDLFLKIRNIDEDDINYLFLAEVKRTVENILYRLEMYR
jgi:cellulose biosynthesis protein BcsQ